MQVLVFGLIIRIQEFYVNQYHFTNLHIVWCASIQFIENNASTLAVMMTDMLSTSVYKLMTFFDLLFHESTLIRYHHHLLDMNSPSSKIHHHFFSIFTSIKFIENDASNLSSDKVMSCIVQKI